MIKNILFDFDGVILDSMPVRDLGFREIFKGYEKELVERLIEYHNINGGLSRFVKIKYFYEELLGKSISDIEVRKYADKFSDIMKKELTKEKYLISESIDFIKANSNKYNLHIVSGSEEKELNYLCREQGVAEDFLTIEGSPTPKSILVENIIKKYGYGKEETILIGDSINDFEACVDNGIDFYGYNNHSLKMCSKVYLENYDLLNN